MSWRKTSKIMVLSFVLLLGLVTAFPVPARAEEPRCFSGADTNSDTIDCAVHRRRMAGNNQARAGMTLEDDKCYGNQSNIIVEITCPEDEDGGGGSGDADDDESGDSDDSGDGQLTSCEEDQRARLLGIIPKWYKYLPYEQDSTGRCAVRIDFRPAEGEPANFQPALPVGLAIIEMLLAIAGVVSVAFVIVGGFRYITSQGEPEHTKAALSTIINALIGGVIAIVATALVSFIAGRLGG